MVTREVWAWIPYERDRSLRFRSLDDIIAEDDPVRLVDEVLGTVDWTPWEAVFSVKRGQPPIHPRTLASIILYGLYRGIRSSRKLEEACAYRFDFMWLVKGQRPDYSTIAKFRTRFHEQLKGLFRHLGRMAMTIGLISLGDVAFDATRVKSNNSRFRTRTAATLEEKLRALDELYDQAVAQTVKNDGGDTVGEGTPTHLPASLASLEQRREKLAAALEQARVADEARRRQGINPAKNPAQVPVTDPDSRVMPNKEGGYAPNYTPTQITDGHRGFILDADVIAEVNEHLVAQESFYLIEENIGEPPKRAMVDAGNSTGPIMQGMEERKIEFFAPVESQQPGPEHPAHRDDPRQPIAESAWPQLPVNNQGQLDKSCFIYDAAQDCYYCPRGEVLRYEETKQEQRSRGCVSKRVYRCDSCSGCPLANLCISRKNKRGRTINRDQYEEVRERTAIRMSSTKAKELYNQRARIAETTFGIIKSVMGFRQFLLRGLEKVKTEWCWAVTAFNLMKLVKHLGRMRLKFAQLAEEIPA